ncbi:prolyl oligopeptidase family serine peptidase [Streptomyces curacoi]|uniref:prolyl oligopeptidase n=1 Tax=Streptomyces curacoi TaxID=146536 RepID=A0A117PAG1_9ACTN|nr:prolyl oligopeptidase family serine peptidase [Streptomyces curacoi]KUM76087.1 peptidase S9 [Streptomyces curacoi]
MPAPSPHGHLPAYPNAPRLDLVENLHQHQIADPYRWLEDPVSPATRQWLAAQDDLFTATRATWTERHRFAQRLSGLSATTMSGPPVWRGGRRFTKRYAPGRQHPAIYVTKPFCDDERALLDPLALDPSGRTTLARWYPSPDGDLVAYQTEQNGTEHCLLHVIETDTGRLIDGPIDRCRYSPIAWLPDSKSFYFVRTDADVPTGEESYHRRVWLHHLGQDPDDDALVFGTGHDPRSYFALSLSADGRWLIIASTVGTAPGNRAWIADLHASPMDDPEFQPIQTSPHAQTMPQTGPDGRLYLLTDLDAPRGKLCVADPADPQEWTELLPEDPEAVLGGIMLLDSPDMAAPQLIAVRQRHATAELAIHDPHTGERTGTVPLPGPGALAGVSQRGEGGHEMWIGYTDYTTPPRILHYDARTGHTRPWTDPHHQALSRNVQTHQVSYASKDGTEVRMLIIAPSRSTSPGGTASDTEPATIPGMPPDRPRPTILYGYGGFGLPMAPQYSPDILAWVEAGGIYAVAGIRGGSEHGEQWHRAAMGASKQNSFDDFHSAAEYLITHGWTTPERLGIHGTSNGGLLVGAALTQRPDLYRAVVCSAPLLDMVRYEKSGLGPTWTPEYGTAGDPEQLNWLLAYSPYHHVQEGAQYPAVLFTTFDQDTRVDPLHARKMCAALQHATTATLDDRPVLLRREADTGHGARSAGRTIDHSADTLAFFAAQLGLSARARQTQGEPPH